MPFQLRKSHIGFLFPGVKNKLKFGLKITWVPKMRAVVSGGISV